MCSCCVGAKAHKINTPSPFNISMRKATRPGYRICTDLIVFNNFPSVEGYKYVSVFVDEYTHFVWIFMLRQKSEFKTCLEWLNKHIKQHLSRDVEVWQEGLGICSIRSDNAKEQTMKAVQELCASNGVKHETSQEYSPHQDGLAEIVIKSLKQGAEAVRLGASWPVSYTHLTLPTNREV